MYLTERKFCLRVFVGFSCSNGYYNPYPLIRGSSWKVLTQKLSRNYVLWLFLFTSIEARGGRGLDKTVIHNCTFTNGSLHELHPTPFVPQGWVGGIFPILT